MQGGISLDEKRDSCECNVIHEDIVNKVKKTCPKKSTFMIWQSFSKFLEIPPG